MEARIAFGVPPMDELGRDTPWADEPEGNKHERRA
jgi:hypothetical protein